MKREFLQNLRAGDQPLPKDLVDAIMAENGRDIEAVKAKFSDYDALREQAQQAESRIRQLEEDSGRVWKEKLQQEQLLHQQDIARMQFDFRLENTIRTAGGRNQKAIAALLDLEELRKQEDPQSLEKAVQAVKDQCGYLFSDNRTPPPYAAGTGMAGANEQHPGTLAGALREKFERND